MNRRLVYRWIAAGTLWLLLLTVLLVSIRSLSIVNKTGQVAKSAMTEQNEQLHAGIRDTARAFAAEWATCNSDSNDYKNRLGIFISKLPAIASPEGIQEVTSSSVLSYESNNKIDYRIKILLHVRRLAPIENNAIPATMIPVTREDLVKMRSTQYDIMQQPVSGWQNFLMCVEVPVKILNNQPVINGLPVIVSNNNTKGEITQPKNYSTVATPDFITFINQFMNMYYGGQALNNFIVSETKIQPLQGWKLISLDEVKVDSEKPTKACVRVIVSGSGIGKITQTIYLKVKSEKGSYLIKDLGSLGE